MGTSENSAIQKLSIIIINIIIIIITEVLLLTSRLTARPNWLVNCGEKCSKYVMGKEKKDLCVNQKAVTHSWGKSMFYFER